MAPFETSSAWTVCRSAVRNAAAVAFCASRGIVPSRVTSCGGIAVGHDRVELAAVRVGNPQDDAVGVEHRCRALRAPPAARGCRRLRASSRAERRDAYPDRTDRLPRSLRLRVATAVFRRAAAARGSLASRRISPIAASRLGFDAAGGFRLVTATRGAGPPGQRQRQRGGRGRPRDQQLTLTTGPGSSPRLVVGLDGSRRLTSASASPSVFSSPSEKMRSEASRR